MRRRCVAAPLVAFVVAGCGVQSAAGTGVVEEETVTPVTSRALAAACDAVQPLALQMLGADPAVHDVVGGSCGWTTKSRPFRSVTLFAYTGSPSAVEGVMTRDLPLPSGSLRVDATCDGVLYELVVPSDSAPATIDETLAEAVC